MLVQEFLHRIDFDSRIEETCLFSDPRKYATHTTKDLFKQLLFQVIAGYKSESASDHLINDPIFTLALGKDALASQPTLSRFIQWWDTNTVQSFHALNAQLGETFIEQLNRHEMVIDLGSTHADILLVTKSRQLITVITGQRVIIRCWLLMD
nr:transposase [Enterococcus raffinosus]